MRRTTANTWLLSLF